MLSGDINLNSQKWLALIFEKKNKEYGAYVHRQDSSDRHVKALIIVTIFAFGLIYLPSFIKSVIPAAKEDVGQTSIARATILDMPDIPEENVIQQIEMPPPPEFKASIAFVAPKIEKDENIRDDDLLALQQDLIESKAEISVATVEGSLDSGVNIADFVENKVIIAAPEEEKTKVWDKVEVDPEFPGGLQKLYAWLGNEVKYPTIAEQRGVAGTIWVRFVVKSDGSVDNVQTVGQPFDPDCDKEAIRAVRKMPKWIPGKQNGVAVNVWFQIPVVFRIIQR